MSGNAEIASGDGNVFVYGFGGGTATSNNNYGVYVESAGRITAGGDGDVSVLGNGGNTPGTGRSNHGVFLLYGNSQITSGGGNVSVLAPVAVVVVAATLTTAFRLPMERKSMLSGSGAVTVVGNGGGVSGNSNNGVLELSTFSYSRLTSAGGDVSVTGMSGGGAASFAVSLAMDGSPRPSMAARSLSVAIVWTWQGAVSTPVPTTSR